MKHMENVSEDLLTLVIFALYKSEDARLAGLATRLSSGMATLEDVETEQEAK